MEIKEKLVKAIEAAAVAAIQEGVFPEGQLPNIVLEVPPKKEMGDFATNIAMQSARAFHMNPRKIAEELTKRITGDWLERVEIAGPGFINFYLKSNVLYDGLAALLKQGEAYGQLPAKDMHQSRWNTSALILPARCMLAMAVVLLLAARW